MKSLRGRLLVWLVCFLTAVGVLAGIAAYILNRNEVDQSLDGQLRQIALNVGNTDSPIGVSRGDGVALDPEDAFVVTIWDQSGQAHSSDPAFQATNPSRPGYSDFEANGERWRGYAQIDQDRTIEVAQRMAVREEFAANSVLRAVLPIAALVPLSWLLGGWILNRILRPLHNITAQLRRWGPAQTSPLSLEGVPDEILPLALATNDLVTRLQAQIKFREGFVSDAAHELRTPLTALRLQAKNLRGTSPTFGQAALIDEMINGVHRMSDLVNKLLQLARVDASTPVGNPIPVSLDEVVARSLQDVMPTATDKRIDIGVVASCKERVVADPEELRTLIGNLIENAVRYTHEGGTIDIAMERAVDGVVLEVRDTGPGIPATYLDRVFGRFVRVPGSDIQGSGLGLPIVRAIADRCGASVALLNRSDCPGLVARVSFPAMVPVS